MSIKSIMLSASGGDPSIEISIGQAQHGSYKVYSWDESGHNLVLIGSGVNWDDIKDCITLGPARQLHQKIISWEVYVSSAQIGAGQLYAVKIIFKQGASQIPGGSFVDSGSLRGTKVISGAVRLVLA
jgi:hypothetical protein